MKRFLRINLKETVLLIISKSINTLQHYAINVSFHNFKSIGKWSTTRKNIAKSVFCNFGGTFKWAIYMNFQMYLSYGYSGLDAVLVNCFSMTCYSGELFQHGIQCYCVKEVQFNVFTFLSQFITCLVLLYQFWFLLLLLYSIPMVQSSPTIQSLFRTRAFLEQ